MCYSFIHSFIYLFVCLFMLCRVACGILVPRPGIEPRATAVKARSPNHWTAREVPGCVLILAMIFPHLAQ